MAYLRCPECMFTNTVKKQEVSAHACCECGFDVGKYYYSEKSQKEANKFIVEENWRIKKLKAKIYRENRKKEQDTINNKTEEIDSTISIEPGFFHDLRLFLITTSRGAFTLTLSLVVLLIYLFSIFAYLKSSNTFADKKMIYPTLPILIFSFSVTFTTPNTAINEFGEMWIYFLYLIWIGIYKLINKLVWNI